MYRPRSYPRHEIPKSGGRVRVLSIPAIRDRVRVENPRVLQLVKQFLQVTALTRRVRELLGHLRHLPMQQAVAAVNARLTGRGLETDPWQRQ